MPKGRWNRFFFRKNSITDLSVEGSYQKNIWNFWLFSVLQVIDEYLIVITNTLRDCQAGSSKNKYTNNAKVRGSTQMRTNQIFDIYTEICYE